MKKRFDNSFAFFSVRGLVGLVYLNKRETRETRIKDFLFMRSHAHTWICWWWDWEVKSKHHTTSYISHITEQGADCTVHEAILPLNSLPLKFRFTFRDFLLEFIFYFYTSRWLTFIYLSCFWAIKSGAFKYYFYFPLLRSLHAERRADTFLLQM